MSLKTWTSMWERDRHRWREWTKCRHVNSEDDTNLWRLNEIICGRMNLQNICTMRRIYANLWSKHRFTTHPGTHHSSAPSSKSNTHTHSSRNNEQDTERRLINDYKYVYMLISLYHTLFTLLLLLLLAGRIQVVDGWALHLFWFCFSFQFGQIRTFYFICGILDRISFRRLRETLLTKRMHGIRTFSTRWKAKITTSLKLQISFAHSLSFSYSHKFIFHAR